MSSVGIETVVMTATAPELSKSDFFDFVTSNEVTDAQYKQQMRSVNVFMESPDSRSNPLLSEEPKEQNNNSLLSVVGPAACAGGVMAAATAAATGPPTALESFDSIWNVDRERDRLDSGMLEDLNKYYWNQDSEINGSHACAGAAIPNKIINNTDGQIYTLTVLNPDISETSSSRYWVKEEDVSSQADIEPPSLDLDSILNMGDFPNEFSQDLPKIESIIYEDADSESQSTDMSTSNPVKVEPFTYEDGEFQNDKNDDPHSPPLITAPTLLESQVEFNNNNNDWKITDQNTESNKSLLRSALQGKAFIRYSSTIQKSKTENTELKSVILNNNNKVEVPSMYQDGKEVSPELLMAISPQSGTVNISILLDNQNTTVIANGENPTSTQIVDDILSNYPDDYEKLKRITTELGESMQPYCTVESLDTSRSVYNIHHVNGELVTMIPVGDVQLHQHHQLMATSPTVSSTKPSAKKHKRLHKSSPPMPQTHLGTNIQAATSTSTSNGVRKERSLHYCSICSKGFKDKYSVNVHVRTHTGEKPFACSLCGKSFRQKAHLAKHYQTHIAQKTAAANGAALKPNKR